MCLISICPAGKRPTLETLAKSRQTNSDGSGVAWTDGTHVHWKKGMEGKEVDDYLATIPRDAIVVIHDRKATIGAEVEALTHPFLLGGAPMPLEGKTKGTLVFHNGHWQAWEDYLLPAIVAARRKIPRGPWSDSRAIAVCMDVYGTEFANLVLSAQRIALLSPDGFETFGKGWEWYQECYLSSAYYVKPQTQSILPSDSSKWWTCFVCNKTVTKGQSYIGEKMGDSYAIRHSTCLALTTKTVDTPPAPPSMPQKPQTSLIQVPTGSTVIGPKESKVLPASNPYGSLSTYASKAEERLARREEARKLKEARKEKARAESKRFRDWINSRPSVDSTDNARYQKWLADRAAVEQAAADLEDAQADYPTENGSGWTVPGFDDSPF